MTRPAQFLDTLNAWTTEAAATLPAPSRLLLQALCRIEEPDRDSTTLDGNWADLWRRLDQPDDPPPLAAAVAPLVAAALIAAEPANPSDPSTFVRYRIHPGIAEAIHAATPQSITAAVDADLAAWWTAVAIRDIEQEQTGQDTSQLVVRAGLAAVPYLLRRHDWDTASRLLEQALTRDPYSPVTAQTVIPSLRCIAEATGEPKDLSVLAAALRRVDPSEAEILLRRACDQATTGGDHSLAAAAVGHLANLLRDQGRLRDALILADQQIEYTRQAGLGAWTQLSNQGQRLQILGWLGHHEQVLTDLSVLRDRLAVLPEQPADNDAVDPWNVRAVILNTGYAAAVALRRWQQALDLNDEITTIKRRRGASAYETARARFNNCPPLLRLGRLTEVDHLLLDCQDVFETVSDIAGLGKVFGARAELEDQRGHLQGATECGRTAQRLIYIHREPRDVAVSHHNLANYLSHSVGDPAEHRAHRLAATLLFHLTDDTHRLTGALYLLAADLHRDPHSPDVLTLPTTLLEVIRLVDAGDGVHFGDLVATLCPDLDTADQALANLLATAATLPDKPAEHIVERLQM